MHSCAAHQMSTPDISQADLIARTALDHYYKVLPLNRGKPQSNQWTVYSAIIATCSGNNSTDRAIEAWVVSCATGSKCTTMQPALSHFGEHIPKCQGSAWGQCKEKCCMEQIKGFVLHDSHAEILARRGLMRVLWEEIIYHLKDVGLSTNDLHKDRTLLQIIPTNDVDWDSTHLEFELKKDIQLHLYISDSPCGDASIYEISPKYSSNINNGNNDGMSFTGAKIVFAHNETIDNENFFICNSSMLNQQAKGNTISTQSETKFAREKIQIKSALRLKSGRSNIPAHLRSSSMSCSDKICRWVVTGLQGCGALTRFIPNPIPLQSIVVSRDPRTLENLNASQLKALERAIVLRAQDVIESLRSRNGDEMKPSYSERIPSLHICDVIFKQGKAACEKQNVDIKVNAVTEQTSLSIQSENKTKTTQNECDNVATSPSRKRWRDIDDDKTELSKKKIKLQVFSSCGICLNWQKTLFNGHSKDQSKKVNIEEVVGAKGIIQGKKPKCSSDVLKSVSRLSRYSLWKQTLDAFILANVIDLDLIKKNHPYKKMKDLLAKHSVRNLLIDILHNLKTPLQGWVRDYDDDDFVPHSYRD